MTATAQLEIDLDALFEAVDRQRRHLRMRRQDVAAELGIAACTLSSWEAGGGIGATAILRVCSWLNCDIRTFAKDGEGN
jgi:transcriptional regulator with XRE-family HTH domain